MRSLKYGITLIPRCHGGKLMKVNVRSDERKNNVFRWWFSKYRVKRIGPLFQFKCASSSSPAP